MKRKQNFQDSKVQFGIATFDYILNEIICLINNGKAEKSSWYLQSFENFTKQQIKFDMINRNISLYGKFIRFTLIVIDASYCDVFKRFLSNQIDAIFLFHVR